MKYRDGNPEGVAVVYFLGTLPPARRASERPIAIACLRSRTILPLRPLLSLPSLISWSARPTFSPAFLPYRAMETLSPLAHVRRMRRFSAVNLLASRFYDKIRDMAESSKDELRIIFRRGGQQKFLREVGGTLPLQEMARICACSPRTMCDWRREKFAMQNECARLLSRRTKIPIPITVSTRDRYAHTRRAGLKGARAVQAKYGRFPVDEVQRKRAWRTWWQSEGKSTANPLLRPRPIRKPSRDSELA